MPLVLVWLLRKMCACMQAICKPSANFFCALEPQRDIKPKYIPWGTRFLPQLACMAAIASCSQWVFLFRLAVLECGLRQAIDWPLVV